MKKKIAAAVIGLMCVVGICGCTKKYEYKTQENSFFVHADGQITAAIIEDFDKDYYDIGELTGLAQQQVLDYNQSKYGLPYYTYDQLTKEQKRETLLPISLESVNKDNGKVILTFRYANSTIYSQFNAIDIEEAGGSNVYISQLATSTMPLEGNFVGATGSKSGVQQDIAELSKKSEYYMVCVDYGTIINFEHEVVYVTDNVYVLDHNQVQTQPNQKSVILFK